MISLASSFRDVRDFIAAKKRKREPLRWHAKGAAWAAFSPRDVKSFERFRSSLRGVEDWGRASERVDRLEHDLRRRHGYDLPLPRKVIQNDDRSLALFWDGCMVRLFEDGVVAMIERVPSPKITTDFLDMLAFLARLQGAGKG